MTASDEHLGTGVCSPLNPELVSALYAVARQDTPTTRAALYAALLDSTLILPTVESFAAANAPLKVWAGENSSGETVLLAFTDADAVLKWAADGADYVALRAPSLFALAAHQQAAEVLINPAGPVGGRVPRHEFALLAEGRLPGDFVETAVVIGSPAPLPSLPWRAALVAILAQHPSIAEAYMFQFHRGQDVSPVVIGVTFALAAGMDVQDAVMAAVVAACNTTPALTPPPEFIVLAADNFLQTVRDTVAPFYTVGCDNP
ncbi:MAG TPA: SseB family protein [Anaerolineae bacterium]|nr:SseB family protein [Anaerolineae bacterium]